MHSQPFKSYKITYYSEANDALDFVILSPHGNAGDEFFKAFPEFEELTYLNSVDLRKLCESEADFGTTELSHKTAEILAEKGYRVAVFESLLPREVIDSNRIESVAIQPLFNFEKHSNWHDRFTMLYREMNDAQYELLGNIRPGGKFLAVHTMRNFDLEDTKGITERNNETEMKMYFQNKLNALKNGGKRSTRVTCFITRSESDVGEVSDVIVDPTLLQNLKTELKTGGIPFAENDPYLFQSIHALYKIIADVGHHGVGVDFVKDLLSGEIVGEPEFDLANLTLNEDKVNRLAEIMVSAMSRSI